MKKIAVIMITLLVFTFCGCKLEDPKYIHFKEKSSPNFYTIQICSLFKNNTDYKLVFYDTDLCKNYDLTGKDKKFILYFFNEIKDEYYISQDNTNLTNLKHEPYQLKIIFNSGDKFVIKIYSPSIVSISPWDGIFEEDFLNIESIPIKYNPYEFCEYLKRRERNTYTE